MFRSVQSTIEIKSARPNDAIQIVFARDVLHGDVRSFYILFFSFYNRGSPRGGPCSLVPFQNCPMFPCSHTLSECFRTVIFRILFPCSQKLANVPLFPSIFCQCSLVPQNPWETLITIHSHKTPILKRKAIIHKDKHFILLRVFTIQKIGSARENIPTSIYCQLRIMYHLEKFNLNFSRSSFAIRVNLLHP